MARKKKSGGGTKRKVAAVGRRAGNFIKKARAAEMLKDAALAVAGGVASGMIANKVPVKDPRIKAALPIVGGIVMAGTIGQKNKIAAGVAQGMVILGTVALFKQLAPKVPMMAGEEYYYLPPGAGYGYPQLMGETVQMVDDSDLMGEVVDMGEDVYFSPADL